MRTNTTLHAHKHAHAQIRIIGTAPQGIPQAPRARAAGTASGPPRCPRLRFPGLSLLIHFCLISYVLCLSFTLDTLLSHVLCLSFSYVVCLSFTLFLLCLMSLFLSCLTSKRDILTCLRETFCISAKVTECARATRPSHMARSTNMSFHVYTPSSGVRHEIALHEAPMR